MVGYRNLGELKEVSKDNEATIKKETAILDLKFLWNASIIAEEDNDIVLTTRSDGIIYVYLVNGDSNSSFNLQLLHRLVVEESTPFCHGILGSCKTSIVDNGRGLSIASISLHGSVRLWNVPPSHENGSSQDIIHPWKILEVASATGTSIAMTSLLSNAAQESANILCCAVGCRDGTIVLFKVNETSLECTAYHQLSPSASSNSSIRCCAWSTRKKKEDELILAVGHSDGTVETFILQEQRNSDLSLHRLHRIMKHPLSIRDLTFTNDSALLSSIDDSGLARIHDTSTYTSTFPLVGSLTTTDNNSGSTNNAKKKPVTICSLATSSNILATAISNKIQLWDLSFASISSSSLPLHTFYLQDDSIIFCMQFSPCDEKKKLICATNNGKLYMFSLK